MKALVVFESIYGNTRLVAEAIGAGLSGAGEVAVLEVGVAPYAALVGVDLLVVGGPTHLLGMSRKLTRDKVRDTRQEPGQIPASPGVGVRDWLDQLPSATIACAAAFDTRAHKVWLLPLGAAAKGIASRLETRGYRLIAGPEGFYVKGTEGPLEEGELERAVAWGCRLAQDLKSQSRE